MQTITELGLRRHRPMWLRVLAVACVLVVTLMSTAQVSHAHNDFSVTKQNSNHNSPSTTDHCPLCVAMHSALAVSQQYAPEPTLSVQRLDSVAAEAARIFRWRFELASRPPPAENLA